MDEFKNNLEENEQDYVLTKVGEVCQCSKNKI